MRLIIVLCVLCAASNMEASYLFKNGHLINEKEVAYLSVEEHYQKGVDALKKGNWDEARTHLCIVMINFEKSSLALEAEYFLGVTLYEKGELDLANTTFSSYIKKVNSTAHLEDVHRYKLAIAQQFALGYKRHMFGCETLPRWCGSEDEALELFDEVSLALPNHELAAAALLGKATVQRRKKEFSSAIDTYQLVVRRFPQSCHALQAFLGIAGCYLQAMKREPQNTDAIALAVINLKECSSQFPQATELQTIEKKVEKMREIHATALFQTAELYERKSELKAATLYYHMTLTQYPASQVAPQCRERLKALSPQMKELKLQGQQ